MEAGELCQLCGHDSGPHIVVAPGNPLDGCIIICQDDDCPCFATLEVHHGEFETGAPCGFCQGDHKPYRCPSIRSRADFQQWMDRHG